MHRHGRRGDVGRGKRSMPLAIFWATSAFGMLLAFVGCAVGPDYVRPAVELNETWSEKDNPQVMTQVAADSTWWHAFGDSTLDQLVELAYRQNLPLQIAGLRILEARAQLGIAVGRQFPQLQVAFANATGVGMSEHAANSAQLDREFWDFQVGFDAIWEMDFWGKYRQGVKAETATYYATIAAYDDALVSLTAEVARTYALIRTFEVLIEQAQANVQVQQEGLRIAQSRFRNGATSELDVSQATTLLESTRASIPGLEIGLQQSRNALSSLLGQPTGSADALLVGPKVIPTAPVEVAVSIPADLLRRRPDIRGVELVAIAECARIGIAKSDLYPSFSLFGSIGTQTTSGAGDASFSNLFGAGSLFYSFGPRVLWSVFNYGRTKNNVRVHDARFQQSLIDYENTVLRAAQEVEDGLVGFVRAREAEDYARRAAESAQRSVDLAVVQYREGAVDFQRVLDAQRSLLQEQNTLARTRSSVATNWISLYKALGGGWELRKGQAVVTDSTRIEMQKRTNWSDEFFQPPADSTSNGSTSTP